MADAIEPVAEEIVEDVEEETEEPAPAPSDDVSELKARIKLLEDKRIGDRERNKLKNQELTRLKREVEKLTAPKAEPSAKAKAGELDQTQLDYLDLKGISEQEDIDLIEKIVARTGMTVREALKDDYVAKKLEANKQAREVKDATPSANKRGNGAGTTDLALAIARFEQTGELPKDFDLAAKVTNAMVDKQNGNKPAWH